MSFILEQVKNHNSYLTDIIEWDIQNWSFALEYWEKYSSLNLANCSVLEIGSKHGGLSLWMALNDAKVVCSNLHETTEKAVQKHRAYGVSHLIRYEALDATDIPYTGHFDVVMFKSVLNVISGHSKERQARAISEMYKALKPGGELFFAENLVGTPLHMFLRKKFVRWSKNCRYLTVEEMKEFLLPFSNLNYCTLGFVGACGRTESQRRILGHLDRLLFNAVIPSPWRYIIVGIAKK